MRLDDGENMDSYQFDVIKGQLATIEGQHNTMIRLLASINTQLAAANGDKEAKKVIAESTKKESKKDETEATIRQ